MIYATLARYSAAFLAGVFTMWLWHNASINRINAKTAKTETVVVTEQLNTAVNDGKQAGDNSGKYIEQIKAANDENDALRQRLSDGTVRLRLCSAESKTTAVQLANTAATANEAEADIARYREDALRLTARGKEVDIWINSAHEWINR